MFRFGRLNPLSSAFGCMAAVWAGAFNLGILGGCSSDPKPTPNDDTDAGNGGSGGSGGGGGSGGDDLGYEPCAAAEEVGEFRIQLVTQPPPGFTGAQGQVFDGVVPTNVPEELDSASGCRLLHGRALFCDPPCELEQTCDTDGSCIPYPRAHSVGTVSVTGLKEALSMEPSVTFQYTNPGSLPHPGFDVGADIRLQAAGGDFQAFNLRGAGVEALELGEQEVIARNKAMVLTWDAPGTPGPARVHIDVNINKHGTRADWIECEASDTGTFTIPADMVNALMDIGISGFPTLTIARRTADSTVVAPGCVEFLVMSERAIALEVDGLTSCEVDADCPDGQTCLSNLTCG